MIPSFTRFRFASALGLVGAVTAVACDRGTPARSTAEARAPGTSIAAAQSTGQYNPAITVYKDPT
jgi:hypothetical protein